MKRGKTSVYVCMFEGCDVPLSRDGTKYAHIPPRPEGLEGWTPLPRRVCSPSCEYRGDESVVDLHTYFAALASA